MNGHRLGAGNRERLYASTTHTFDGDLDYIAIEYALNGERVKLTQAEKIYTAKILDARGKSPKTIGKYVGASGATVEGWKASAWNPAGTNAKTGRRPRRPEPVCGEARMYRRHLKAGETCEVCKAANAAADRRYRNTGSQKEVA